MSRQGGGTYFYIRLIRELSGVTCGSGSGRISSSMGGFGRAGRRTANLRSTRRSGPRMACADLIVNLGDRVFSGRRWSPWPGCTLARADHLPGQVGPG